MRSAEIGQPRLQSDGHAGKAACLETASQATPWRWRNGHSFGTLPCPTRADFPDSIDAGWWFGVAPTREKAGERGPPCTRSD